MGALARSLGLKNRQLWGDRTFGSNHSVLRGKPVMRGRHPDGSLTDLPTGYPQPCAGNRESTMPDGPPAGTWSRPLCAPGHG